MLIGAEIMMEMVKTDSMLCEIGLGKCVSESNCEARCAQLYGPGTGKCDLTPPICTCYYNCAPPPPPAPAAPRCNANDGLCDSCGDDCCTVRCKDKFTDKKNVVGSCQDIVGTPERLCLNKTNSQ